MKIETKFEIGDRVTDGVITGKVTYIKVMNYTSFTTPYTDIEYSIEVESRNDYTIYVREEGRLTLAPKKLTPEEAWLECALKIGMFVTNAGLPIYDSERSIIRHECYVILGGNDVEVGRQGTTKHEEVKAQLNGLIERAIVIEGEE